MTPATSTPASSAIEKLSRLFGVDRAIAYTLVGRGWNVLAGPLTIFLIARSLRPDEQGFYYTFGSVIALNIFFELGLTYVLLQFASHEKAHLEWTEARTLSGSSVAHVRLAALLKLALRWYSFAALLAICVVMPAGLVFFTRNSPGSVIPWRIPWVWLVSTSALNMLISPLFAILEGCGRISQIASMRVIQGVIANIGLWLTLVLHGGLAAGPMFQTLNVASSLVWLVLNYSAFFRNLFETDVSEAQFHWRSEVWPFQWRIALSWLSGYFIFQLFNPALFASHGPVAAGQMGMSLSLCTALLGVSMAWMNTKASPFGVLVARRQWQDLDQVFFRTLLQSFLVLVAGSLTAIAIVLGLNYLHHPFANRILPPLPFAFLLLAAMMNHIVFCEAQYLRAHKTEPFLWLSILVGALTAGSIFFLAKPYGAVGVSAGYLGCCFVLLVTGTRTFIQKRKEWHA